MFVHIRRCLVALALCAFALPGSTGLFAQPSENPIRKQIFAFPDTGVVSPVPGLARDNAGALYGAAVWGGLRTVAASTS